MTLWSTRVAAALTIALTVVACSLDDLIPEGALGFDDGAGAGAKESLKVDGNSEGRIEIAETGATLTVPKGAVEHSVTIGVERPSDAKAIKFVESLKTVKAVASAPYVLTPHGTEFTKDLKLQIPVVANKGKELVAAYLKDESDRQWKYLDTPHVEGDVATVTLKHFSVIVLLEREGSGFEDEGRDAGASDGPGDEVRDAGASEAVDSGSEPQRDDDRDSGGHGSDALADAGTSSAPDAGTSTAIDAGSSAPVDAAEPTSPVAEAGDGAHDSGHDSYADAEVTPEADGSTQLPDAAVQLPPDDASGGAGQEDASVDPDSSYPATGCLPYTPQEYCEYDQCGFVADGCGGVISCGDCEAFGGVCGQYQPGRCGYPIGQ